MRMHLCETNPPIDPGCLVRPALFKLTDSSAATAFSLGFQAGAIAVFVAVDFTRSKSVVALARLRSQSTTSMTARLNSTKRV